jgi:hypothetical protein
VKFVLPEIFNVNNSLRAGPGALPGNPQKLLITLCVTVADEKSVD